MSKAPSERPESNSAEPRVIKRYHNRKLYDTRDSRYVTLLQIAEMIRGNEAVQIIDNATKEDKTDLTCALIISEELKVHPHGIPLATLKALIRQRGERLLGQLRDGPIRLLMSRDRAEGEALGAEATPSAPEEGEDISGDETQPKGLRATLDQWQQTIDERLRAVLPGFSTIRELQAELKRVSDRLAAIEKGLDEAKRDSDCSAS